MKAARPPERNFGCRVSDDYQYRGLRTIVLENARLRVSVLADKGTDIFEFLYKPMDIDFMYRAPAGVRDPRLAVPSIANPAGEYLDYWHGGWQEAFPTGGWPCRHAGASFGLHGEVNLIPWSYRITEDEQHRVSVHFWARTMRSPFLIEKTLSLEGDIAELRISERVTNEGAVKAEFMWGHHPVIGPPFLDESCFIAAAADAVVVPEESLWPRGRLKQGRYRWPMAEDRGGRPVDLSRVLPAGAGVADGIYLTELREGRCSVVSGRLGLSWSITWPKEVFPWIWLWHVAGGETDAPFFGRNYNLAIEPFTSFPNSFEAVRAAGTQKKLQPGESLDADLAVTVFTPGAGGRIV